MTPIDRRTLFRTAGVAGASLAATPLLSGPAAAAPPGAGVASATGASAAGAVAGAATPNRARVTTGADVLAQQDYSLLAGKKVGVITNPTGIGSDLRNIVDTMHEAGTVNIVGVFGPEHGFRGTAQAGGSEGTFIDERTGLTVYDAYGANATKMTQLFTEAGVDTVVFDIQDVGARFYTYIWTMYTAMRAAVAVDASFVVLDRPNPTGGRARGPMMTPEYTSGVGAEAIVQAHGMTVGELAGYFDGEILPTDTDGAHLPELTVVQMKGWKPSMRYADTGLPWVPPSPNMPTADTALLYSGTGMFEGTLAAEGRGTTRPFELMGAPWIDYRWAEALTARDIPGVDFREAYFNPSFGKFVGEVCGGVQVHITDPLRLDPITVAVEMIVALKSLYPEFDWRYDTYDPERPYWIDKLTGSTRLREQINGGADAATVVGAWQAELADFERKRRQYLLYKGPRV